jgi:putative membrane protein
MTFVARTLMTALALWLTSLVVPNNVDIKPDGKALETFLALLVVALIFNIVHAIIKPIVKVFSLPLFLLTLGLFSLVVNAVMLWIVVWVTGQGWIGGEQQWGLVVHGGFWWYLIAALIISVFQVVINRLSPKSVRR